MTHTISGNSREPPIDRDSPGRRFLFFACLGPVAGSTVCMLIAAFELSRGIGDELGGWIIGTLTSVLFIAPFSYFVGLWPALLLALLTCAYPRRLPIGWRIVLSALLGSTLSAGFMFIAKPMGMGMRDMLLAGAGAGAFCEWRVSRLRQRAVLP